MMLRVVIPVVQFVQKGLRGLQWCAYFAGKLASGGAHALDRWIVSRLRNAGGVSSLSSRGSASSWTPRATHLARRDAKSARRVFSHRMPGDRE